jgi:hypothetical protein
MKIIKNLYVIGTFLLVTVKIKAKLCANRYVIHSRLHVGGTQMYVKSFIRKQ